MKTGIVDVGGGMRGIYAAGVLDYCLNHHIHFDMGIGVSAGSANLASFAANQSGRNYRFYTEFAMRKEYMGLGNFLRKRAFFDLDYVYGTLSNSDGEAPLDYLTLKNNPMELIVVATEARTGNPRYFQKEDIAQDAYHVFKASSAIPYINLPRFIDGKPYYDGALSDPVPIQKAFDSGCERVALLLTLPENAVRTSGQDKRLAAKIRGCYPCAAEKLERRVELYNQQVALAKEYAAKGKLCIIAPDNTCGVTTLNRNAKALEQLYKKGYNDAERISAFLA